MHLGLTPWHTDRSAQALIEQASFAEHLGYESFWLPENHFDNDAIPDPLMLLASIAGAATQIKLATTSYLLPLRHPLQAAEQVAVLDQLSGGRLILGVGRGVGTNMLKAFNVQPQQKRERFESNLKLMIEAWSGASLATGGDPASAVVLHPLPIQKPHPQIWVAAFGPKALAQAGRLGLPYLASPLETLDELENNFSLHNQACQNAQQVILTTRPIMRMVFIDNNNAGINTLRKQLQKNNATNPWRDQHAPLDDWAIVGNEEFVRQQIAEYQQRLGMTHLIITRLRMDDVSEQQQRESLTLIAELVDGNTRN
ncbi:MAG: hypothetical protein DRR42_13295 [Gammaproteobacteria bacterium]|nr:MAG: hypothetical protein DRR42_13295 [Gammaproteobacteria bacterium]